MARLGIDVTRKQHSDKCLPKKQPSKRYCQPLRNYNHQHMQVRQPTTEDVWPEGTSHVTSNKKPRHRSRALLTDFREEDSCALRRCYHRAGKSQAVYCTHNEGQALIYYHCQPCYTANCTTLSSMVASAYTKYLRTLQASRLQPRMVQFRRIRGLVLTSLWTSHLQD